MPAQIQLDNTDEEAVWKWLQTEVDPLFTRDLPPNENALRLYESWITNYLEGHGQPDIAQRAAIRAESIGQAGRIERVVFKAITMREVKKKGKR